MIYSAKYVHPQLPADFSVNDSTSRVQIPYYVEFASAANPIMALNAKGGNGTQVPRPGDRCRWCTSLYYDTARVQTINGKQYIVTVEFANLPGGKGESKSREYPWKQAPDISFGSERRQVVVDKAYKEPADDKPTVAILNSAGDMFNDPPQINVSDSVISVSWNVRRFNISDIGDYRDTINAHSVTICGIVFREYTLCMTGLSATPCITNDGDEYWKLSATMTARDNEDGWRYRPLDAGWKAIINTPAPVKPLIDGTGTFYAPTAALLDEDKTAQEITEQILLDGNGNLLASTQSAMRTATPVYLDFNIIKAANWSQLDIPTRLK